MNTNDFSPSITGARAITRRHFYKATGLGFGAMALQSLLARDGVLAQSANPLAPKPPMFAPKAKRVIYLHMAGSPSQLELFEHKPDLRKLHMKDCPPSFLEGKRFAFISGKRRGPAHSLQGQRFDLRQQLPARAALDRKRRALCAVV